MIYFRSANCSQSLDSAMYPLSVMIYDYNNLQSSFPNIILEDLSLLRKTTLCRPQLEFCH